MSTATTTMPPHTVDPASLVRPRRVITGMSAILLPMKADDSVDWDGFDGSSLILAMVSGIG